MPIYEVELSDGRTFEVEADAPPTEADVMAHLGSDAPKPEQSSGLASGMVMGARAVPGVLQKTARFAANHPAATQKIIGAGVSATAGGIGGAVGGVPGAVVGASIRGVTPAQTVIRETAGRLAGETPAAARNAAQGLGIQNYAKELGTKVLPGDIINKPNAANAIEHYANSAEKGILRLYDAYGNVVSGPSSVNRIPSTPKPGMIGKLAAKVAPVLGPLSAMTGATDLAQTVEPTRRDIGVMGIGASVPDPAPDELQGINDRNVSAMNSRLQSQDQQQADLIQRLLQALGLR